jgi:Cellulose binding domain
VTDTGSTALTGWTVTFTFGGDQQVTNYWNAAVTQSINYVTASSLSYNGAVAAGGSTSFGFQGTYSSSYAAPTSVTCTPSSTVTPAIVASPGSQPVMQGFSSTFGVALPAAPSAKVTVSVGRTAGDTGLSASAGASLTFTPTDWDTAQNVTIAADTAARAC